MSSNSLKKFFISLLFLFLPLIVFSQSNRTQSVALVPFWGPDEQFIQDFGEELYKGVNDMQGYRSVVIDMANLPDDVPEGGFPPYICPSPSLTKTNPIALTGEMTTDPDDDEFWHLRLYLWEMAETRLVFSDELTAYDREECAASLPGMLDWLFSWLKRGGAGSGFGEGDGDLSNQYTGKQIFITTSMPLHWMYVGGRFGWTPLRMQGVPSGDDSDKTHVLNEYKTLNGAVSFTMSLFPEAVPFFSRLSVQAEGMINFDFEPVSTTTLIPAILLKGQVYRIGNLLFSLFGGAYIPLPLDDNINYSGDFPIGLTAGATFGGKFDPVPGLFFIDVRYSMDLVDTTVKKDGNGYRRNALTISIGYEYGLITKK